MFSEPKDFTKTPAGDKEVDEKEVMWRRIEDVFKEALSVVLEASEPWGNNISISLSISVAHFLTL